MNSIATVDLAGDAHSYKHMFITDGVFYSPYVFPANGHAEIEALH
jgi:hypothetical protein